MELVDWYNNGADPAKYPNRQRDKDDWGSFIVIKPDGIYSYEQSPTPVKLEDKNVACGSGRDFAITAMHLGKTAIEAVEIACLFDTGCGNGIDWMTL